MNNDMSYSKIGLWFMALVLVVVMSTCQEKSGILAPDITAPAVISTDPANAATGVAVSSKINATFNEDINATTISTTTFLVRQGTTPVIGTVTFSGKMATFTPSANLAYNVIYTATIKTGAHDLPGNALTNDFVWNFSTGAIPATPDTTKPAVISTIPVNAATNVSISSKLTAAFSKAIDPATITTATFTVKGPGVTPVTGTVVYDAPSKSAVFTPAGNLAANTAFAAMITTGVKDLAGNALAGNYTWNFTTGSIPDTTAPSVSSVYPVNAAAGVVISSKLYTVFSEAMDPLTITTATFTLRKGTTPVIGALTYSGLTATFTPSGNLEFNGIYTATITTGAKDLAGNALPSNFVWNFTTGAIPDTTAPTVISTIPLNAATGVSISSKLTADFSEVMDLSTISTVTFTVKGPGGTPVTGTVVYDVPSMSAIFAPAGSLAANTTFTATITTGAIGHRGNAIESDYIWNFTTGATPDTTAPTVISTIPVNAATGVDISSKLYTVFSEAMDPLTITTATFALRKGTTAVMGTLTYSGLTAIFTPVGDLEYNGIYTATIRTGAKDLAGNGLASNFVWNFTTGAAPDITAPTVLSTIPVNAATAVDINSKLTAVFSEPMTPATLNTATFTVKGPGETPVTGTVAYVAASNSVIFTPAANLAPNTGFTAVITTGATGQHGNKLTSNYIWNFTTGATPDTTKPAVLSTIPVNAATGVAINSKLNTTFSEVMDPLTINTTTFTLRKGTTAIIGTLTYSGITAIFTPAGNLEFNAAYTATVTTGAKDLAGNALARNFVWTFTTGAIPDTIKPAVISTIPVNAATGVSISNKLTAGFSKAMDPSTITIATFTVKGPGVTPVTGTVVYNVPSKSAVFTPAGNLAPNTTFTGTITTGAEDVAGNALANNFTWNFATGATPDTIKPAVLSTIPVNAATGVAINSKLYTTFSESMDPLTISATTFTLRKGTTPVIGTLTYSGITATFTPAGNLEFNAAYTATITTGAKDLAGNALAGNFVWNFSTGAAPDTAKPTVISTIPVNAATGVSISSKLTAAFSEAMEPLTITTATFTVKGPGVTPVTGTVVYDVPSMSGIFTPAGNLAANTTYTATITTGAIGQRGNALASNYVWTFTTGATPDTTKPTVLSTIPVDAATGVAISSNVYTTFSEAMDPLTITTATFTVRTGTTPVIGTLTYSGITATFTPAGDLAANTTFTGTITTGAKDLAGNALASNFVWNFTTGATADTTKPTVISTIPVNAATGISTTSKLTAAFSQAMTPTTLNTATFTVKGPGETPVTGSIVYAATSNSAIFTPAGNLVPNTTFTATITTGAQNLAGNALASNFVWTFATGATADTTKPTVLSTIPVDTATGVDIASKLYTTFSEAMDPLTITTATFTARHGTTPVIGTLTYSGTTAIFTPVSNLEFNAIYTGTITTGAKDLAGNSLASNFIWNFTTATGDTTVAPAGPAQVNLGSAGDFAILAGQAVTSTGFSIISGNLGLSPGALSSITGFPPGTVVNGSIFTADNPGQVAIVNQAKLDLTAAYIDAAGRALSVIVVSDGELGGKTLAPGLYKSGISSFAITSSDVTLAGGANDVWIFQMPSSTFTVGNGRRVILSGGAQAKNIYWSVGSSATLGTTSVVNGNILADQSITLQTGATLNGRALTRIAAVTLDASTITKP